jgi:hypothetical protein
VNGSLTVNDVEFALRAALDGIGIVQLPEAMVAPLIAQGRLAPVLADWSPQWTEFVLFYSSRRHVPVKLRVLVDFLRRESRQAARAASEQRKAQPAPDAAHNAQTRVHRLQPRPASPSTVQRDRTRRSDVAPLSSRAGSTIMESTASVG